MIDFFILLAILTGIFMIRSVFRANYSLPSKVFAITAVAYGILPYVIVRYFNAYIINRFDTPQENAVLSALATEAFAFLGTSLLIINSRQKKLNFSLLRFGHSKSIGEASHGVVLSIINLLIIVFCYSQSYQNISWGAGSYSLGGPIYGLIYKSTSIISIIGLALSRSKSSKFLNSLSLMICVSVFVQASSRSDLVYLAVAFWCLQSTKIASNIGSRASKAFTRPYLKFICIFVVLVILNFLLLAMRQSSLASSVDIDSVSMISELFLSFLVNQDYTTPGLTLALSHQYDIGSFEEVISIYSNGSTISNTLAKFIMPSEGYIPFLKGAGIAYYYLTDLIIYLRELGIILAPLFTWLVFLTIEGLVYSGSAILLALSGYFIISFARAELFLFFKSAALIALIVYTIYITSLMVRSILNRNVEKTVV